MLHVEETFPHVHGPRLSILVGLGLYLSHERRIHLASRKIHRWLTHRTALKVSETLAFIHLHRSKSKQWMIQGWIRATERESLFGLKDTTRVHSCPAPAPTLYVLGLAFAAAASCGENVAACHSNAVECAVSCLHNIFCSNDQFFSQY